MPHMSINISSEAYGRLKKRKLPGDSFSDVILRELPASWDTAGEVLDGLFESEVPKANPKLRAAVLSGRGRRSSRK